MKTTRRRSSFSPIATLALTALAANTVCATDGYFDYGYGIQAKGIGCAGVAFPQDSLAPATNPAGVAFLTNRVDAGLTYFQPDRSASLGPGQFDANGIQHFYIPELGFNYSLSELFDTALAVYGNGGMNTDYTTPVPGFGTTHSSPTRSSWTVARRRARSKSPSASERVICSATMCSASRPKPRACARSMPRPRMRSASRASPRRRAKRDDVRYPATS